MDPTTADAIAAIVADLRPLHDDLALPDIAEIQREVETRDGRGGVTVEWQDIATVRCELSVSGMSGNEYVVGNVETVNLPYVVTMPFGTDVTEQDRLTIAGRTFVIETVRQGEGFAVALEAACREVTP